MQYRCLNAFATANRVYAGGELVDGDDPIVETHRAHFVEVGEAPSPRAETASTDEPRPARKPAVRKAAAANKTPEPEPEPEDVDES